MINKRLTNGQSSQLRLVAVAACSICLIGCLMPVRPVQAGRLQDFIQNLVGGRDSNSNSNSSSGNSNNNNANNNSNNNNDSSDSDASASGETSNDQPMTPMMSNMNPFMRYPNFYDSFAGSPAFGGFPGMSFGNPMAAMSGMSPMAAMSTGSMGTFSPATYGAFGPASFGSFGPASSTHAGQMSSFSDSQQSGSTGMGSNLNSFYTSSPNLMGGFSPYYGRRR